MFNIVFRLQTSLQVHQYAREANLAAERNLSEILQGCIEFRCQWEGQVNQMIVEKYYNHVTRVCWPDILERSGLYFPKTTPHVLT